VPYLQHGAVLGRAGTRRGGADHAACGAGLILGCRSTAIGEKCAALTVFRVYWAWDVFV
jgi:hypothetical protein